MVWHSLVLYSIAWYINVCYDNGMVCNDGIQSIMIKLPFPRRHTHLDFQHLQLTESNGALSIKNEHNKSSTNQSLFSTRRFCSREQRKKHLDWLATNTDDIIIQSLSLTRLVENGLNRGYL